MAAISGTSVSIIRFTVCGSSTTDNARFVSLMASQTIAVDNCDDGRGAGGNKSPSKLRSSSTRVATACTRRAWVSWLREGSAWVSWLREGSAWASTQHSSSSRRLGREPAYRPRRSRSRKRWERSLCSCRLLPRISSRRIDIRYQSQRRFMLRPNGDDLGPFPGAHCCKKVRKGDSVAPHSPFPPYQKRQTAAFEIPPRQKIGNFNRLS